MGRLAGEVVALRLVIETARDASYIAAACQAMKNLINSLPRSEIEKVARGPNRRPSGPL